MFMDDKVNCMKCKHYYVTWDPSFPKGCKLYGFKTSRLPASLVYESTGKQCESYEERAVNRQDRDNV